jgi:hypothetical protein
MVSPWTNNPNPFPNDKVPESEVNAIRKALDDSGFEEMQVGTLDQL